MLQAFLVVSSIAMAGTAAFIYRTSFDEGVRSGNEVLIALPTNTGSVRHCSSSAKERVSAPGNARS
ncbi:MAG: hypothetical protein AAFP04_13085, partial [Myxococcota bacterium]